MPAPAEASQYREAAIDKFSRLMKVYKELAVELGRYFGKLGNSFDTMIDFLDVVDADSADDVADIVLKQYAASLKALGGYVGALFDDFGWWTIATERALRKPYFSPESKLQSSDDVVSNCWKRFTGNAPYVCDRRTTDHFDESRPAVDGGVWNAYWDGTDLKYAGPRGDPANGGLQGIQNTATNALYLIAAQRLSVTDSTARTAAEQEYEFFKAWCWEQQPSLLWHPQPCSTMTLSASGLAILKVCQPRVFRQIGRGRAIRG
jgi:hypothetical protein